VSTVKKAFLVNIDRCIGCYACEIACKDENDLSQGIRRVQVKAIDIGDFNRFYVPIFALEKRGIEACTLCPQLQAEGRRPACVNNCLTNALHFGDSEEMEERANAMVGDKFVSSYKKANIVYISKKPLDEKLIIG
jgi:Fe-S-cluster-containing dehydrogenase component